MDVLLTITGVFCGMACSAFLRHLWALRKAEKRRKNMRANRDLLDEMLRAKMGAAPK